MRRDFAGYPDSRHGRRRLNRFYSSSLPRNRLQRLRGHRADQYSIRINDQYRICFRWEDGYADDVEVTDYH